MKNWESTLQWLTTYLQRYIARTTSEAVLYTQEPSKFSYGMMITMRLNAKMDDV